MPFAVGETVTALQEYRPGPDSGYLTLRKGCEVLIQHVGSGEDADWLFGSAAGQSGWFPLRCLGSGNQEAIATALTILSGLSDSDMRLLVGALVKQRPSLPWHDWIEENAPAHSGSQSKPKRPFDASEGLAEVTQHEQGVSAPLTDQQVCVLGRLCDITGLSSSLAQKLLESKGWSLEMAVRAAKSMPMASERILQSPRQSERSENDPKFEEQRPDEKGGVDVRTVPFCYTQANAERNATEAFQPPYGLGSKEAQQLQDEVMKVLQDGQKIGIGLLRGINDIGMRFNRIFWKKDRVNNGSWKKWLHSLPGVELDLTANPYPGVVFLSQQARPRPVGRPDHRVGAWDQQARPRPAGRPEHPGGGWDQPKSFTPLSSAKVRKIRELIRLRGGELEGGSDPLMYGISKQQLQEHFVIRTGEFGRFSLLEGLDSNKLAEIRRLIRERGGEVDGGSSPILNGISKAELAAHFDIWTMANGRFTISEW
eukprot:TRINITY_DN105777_c0_g1_i1.p1 TRINITY_DN105777_c0_g1~~TRINITY_DN105777_c0_g1_i1.p1  ORF type:complete len:482 (-),score=64.30 TRINITY_DN105777_c0_g1_i1:131-1576(-)